MSWGVRDLTVRFGRRAALERVTLQAAPGEVRGVVGGDGAGKSTLLRALVGALPTQAGQVSRPASREIGYMPATSGVYADLTVEENLEFVAHVYGLSRRDLAARIQDLLSRAGLLRARDRLGGELSGGMRQKLGLVLAMLHSPALIALDEPTTGVDPVSRRDLWWLIAHAASQGAAVVLSTTYLDEAARMTRLLFLDQGKVRVAGSPEGIISSLPGSLYSSEQPPGPVLAAQAWRRGSAWRIWCPPEAEVPAGEPLAADLEDAVTCSLLRYRQGDEAQRRQAR